MSTKYIAGISGRYGKKIDLLTGQAVKTKILDKALREEYGEEKILALDTYNWKRNPFGLMMKCISMFKNAENIIFLPAQGGVKVFTKLYLFLNKFYHRRLHYYVVGGWIVEKIEKDQSLENALKKLDGIYVELQTMKKQLEERGFTNVYYVSKFRELNPISEKEIPVDFTEPLKVCTFSRVMKEKGIEDACNAVKKVNTYFGRTVYQLDIYGQVDTQYKDRFDRICGEFPNFIRYGGEVPFEESTTVLKEYYLLLFPTVYHGEGYPNTLVDAFAAGLPVVATNWKYNQELINNGKDGIVYDYHVPEQIEKILIDLAQDKEKVKKMKINCVKRCNEYIPKNAIRPLIQNME